MEFHFLKFVYDKDILWSKFFFEFDQLFSFLDNALVTS